MKNIFDKELLAIVAVSVVGFFLGRASGKKACGSAKVASISENTSNASGRAVPTTPANMTPAQLTNYMVQKSFPGGSENGM